MSTDARRAVLTYIHTGGDARFGGPYLVAGVTGHSGCTTAQVWEALWSLVADRLAFLDPSGQAPDNWRWRLTADGAAAAGGGSWEPRDSSGYLDRLKREVVKLDTSVELYLAEALTSFNSRCFLASSVMLGVAAERAFHLMAQAFADSSLTGAAGMAQELAKPRNSYFTLLREFRKRIEPLRNDLPDGLADALTLDAFADLIRITRNEAGHPTGRRIDEDTALVHLQMAPVYLKKMHQLRDYCARFSAVADL